MIKAVVYCRVSSDRQVKEGHGLDGQELRCLQYAKVNSYEVVKIFRDEGASGGTIDRPALLEMFDYMEKKKDIEMVIFEDVSRIARDMAVHIEILAKITKLGAKYQTVNQPIENTVVGKFIVQSLANVSELHRNLNTQNVKNKMRNRLEKGYWTFDNPPGYKYIIDRGHGKLLSPHEPNAGIIKEMLEGFASKRFITKEDCRQFLQTKSFQHRAKNKQVHLQQVIRLLERASIYAGFIEYERWKIERRKGHHRPLISQSTFDKINARLSESSPISHRKDLHLDFSLRGYAACASCMELMTASWSKGRGKRYPYYRCTTPQCSNRNKSIRKEKIESEFDSLLKRTKAKKETLDLLQAVFDDVWSERINNFAKDNAKRDAMAKDIDEKIQNLIEKIEITKSKNLVARYERRVEELEMEQDLMKSQSSLNSKWTQEEFGTAFQTVRKFLQNPCALWNSGVFENQRTVLRLAFTNVIPFSKENGVGTAPFSLLFELCRLAKTDKNKMVEMPGFEPGSNV